MAGFYQRYLDRPVDIPGLDAFAGILARGGSDEQRIAFIAASDEYFHKTEA